MEAYKYSDLLRRLEGFDPWLSKLGLTPRPDDRLHRAFEVLRKADEASRRGIETGIYSDIEPGDWFPIIEALEAHDIFTAFENDLSPQLSSALKRALSGPLQPIHETHRNRDGRNIWYELSLAAEWKLRGARISLEEPDMRLTRDDVTFLVACKRPAALDSVEANTRRAIRQLRDNLDAMEGCTNFGIAAVSLNCAFNAGDRVFSGDLDGLRAILEEELEKNRPYLSKIRDPRICCVMYQVTTPAVGDNRVDLVRTSFTVAQETVPSKGLTIFKDLALHLQSSPKRAREWNCSDNS